MGFGKSDNIGSFQIPLFYVIRNSVGIPYYIKGTACQKAQFTERKTFYCITFVTPMKSCLYYGIIDEVFIDENV